MLATSSAQAHTTGTPTHSNSCCGCESPVPDSGAPNGPQKPSRDPGRCCCADRNATKPSGVDGQVTANLTITPFVIVVAPTFTPVTGGQALSNTTTPVPLHVLNCVWNC